MPDLTSLENLYLIVGFFAPGLIVLFVRSQFVTGRIAPDLGAVSHPPNSEHQKLPLGRRRTKENPIRMPRERGD